MARVGGLVAALLAASLLAEEARAGDLAVIVHPGREVEIGRTELAQIYLRKRRFWKNGERIVPVNRDSGSAARAAFARAIFGDETRHLAVYWNRRYFDGVLPPLTLASDEAVKRFVVGEPLAIGYIDASLVDGSVKVVLRIHTDSP